MSRRFETAKVHLDDRDGFAKRLEVNSAGGKPVSHTLATVWGLFGKVEWDGMGWDAAAWPEKVLQRQGRGYVDISADQGDPATAKCTGRPVK